MYLQHIFILIHSLVSTITDCGGLPLPISIQNGNLPFINDPKNKTKTHKISMSNMPYISIAC